MTANMPRKGTFVLSEPDAGLRESGLEKQNVMRLRINRIALIQELRVEHVLCSLIEAGILNEDDLKQITSGSTAADKARVLVDMLPGKGKNVDWYRAFREALQNPDAGQDVKKRYKGLVEFLDNTVIHRPQSQGSRFGELALSRDSMKLPRYQPLPTIESTGAQNVLNIDDERKQEDERVLREFSIWSGKFDTTDSLTLVKGYFQQWISTPENFSSLIVVPEKHFQRLQKSSEQADKDQLKQENRALDLMKKLEIVTVLARRKLLPVGFELCMCDVVQEIMQEAENYHLYFKYLKALESLEVNLLQDILNSFYSVLKSNLKAARNSESVKQFTALAFHLVDFMTEYGYYTDAEQVMVVLMTYLSESHQLDIWMTKYHGYIKSMHLRNKNYRFSEANQAFQCAVEMTWQIRMMSFGQDLLDETEINNELSHMLLELGSINPAFSWSQNALKEIRPGNDALLVRILCNAVMTYCARWQVKRAEKLAIYAVQMAKQLFGVRNPLYLEALLALCHFSTEFKQDETGLQVAKHALSTAKKIYACETIQVALAHRAVSKALLVLQQFDTEKYYLHACEALRIAKNSLSDEHPMLYLFLHTSASALQWKAFHASKETQEMTLCQAETEAKHALELVTIHYGEISLRTAQIYSLLGQIYSKMESEYVPGTEQYPMQMAEDMLQTSVALMKLCQPNYSYFRLLSAATLGTFYKITEKPKSCLKAFCGRIPADDSHLLTKKSPGVYLKWVHSCFESLIQTLQSLNMNKQADHVQIQLSHWLKDNPRLDSAVTMATLHEEPPVFKKFMEDFNIWEKKTQKVIEFAREQKERDEEEKRER